MSSLDLAVVVLCSVVGFTLQGAVGFGMGILGTPILLLVDPRLVTDWFLVHCTSAPGSSVTIPGSTDGGVNSGEVILEAVNNDALNWKPVSDDARLAA